MTFDEFIELRKQGKVSAGIDNSTALQLIDSLPRRYQSAHTFWSWVWMLSIPAFICVAIFIKWWAGLLLLIFVTPTISKSVKQSASQFVLEHASENQDFFEKLTKNNLLVFRRIERGTKAEKTEETKQASSTFPCRVLTQEERESSPRWSQMTPEQRAEFDRKQEEKLAKGEKQEENKPQD